MSSHLFRAQLLHKVYSTEQSGTLFYENWRQSKTFFQKDVFENVQKLCSSWQILHPHPQPKS